MVQEPGQVQRGSGGGFESSGEGLGSIGAEPGHVQQSSRQGSGEVPEKVWEALVLSQVRFNVFNRVSSAWLCSTFQKDL